MSATTTALPHIGPAAVADLLVAHVGLLDIADDGKLALAILDRLRGTGIPVGTVTTDFDAVRAELAERLHARIADRFDAEHLAAVEAQSRGLRERLGRRG